MRRSRIATDSRLQRRARRKAWPLGVSFSGHVRGPPARDLAEPVAETPPSTAFALGGTIVLSG